MTRRGPRRSSATAGEFRRSMVQVRIGAKTYDAVYVPSCHTCTHPARMLIEEKILQNYPWRAIAELYSETDIEGENGHPLTLPRLTHQSIHNHFSNGHMPIEAATLRKLAERRAKQIGAKYEEATEQFADHVMLAEATVAKVYERLVKGEIEPDVRDGLAAAKLIADLEADTGGAVEAEAWSEAMTIYFETAREVMEPAMWARFTAQLSRNPILRAIERKLSPDPNVIDADVVAIGGS